MQKIRAHFKKIDPILFAVLEKITLEPLVKANTFFPNLCKQIINQQLSTYAGRAVFTRFKALFPKEHIAPELALKLSDEKIRNAGLSYSKIKYIKGLSEAVVNKKIDLNNLATLSDAEVIVTLTKIKGIGLWTAEMFLLSSLGREDVFSFGDVGLMRAIKNLYQLDAKKDRVKIEKLIAKWSPYKSYACRILWSSLK